MTRHLQPTYQGGIYQTIESQIREVPPHHDFATPSTFGCSVMVKINARGLRLCISVALALAIATWPEIASPQPFPNIGSVQERMKGRSARANAKSNAYANLSTAHRHAISATVQAAIHGDLSIDEAAATIDVLLTASERRAIDDEQRSLRVADCRLWGFAGNCFWDSQHDRVDAGMFILLISDDGDALFSDPPLM